MISKQMFKINRRSDELQALSKLSFIWDAVDIKTILPGEVDSRRGNINYLILPVFIPASWAQSRIVLLGVAPLKNTRGG